MPSRDRLDRLDTVAATLPFAVEDHAAVNAAFQRWYATGDGEALGHAEVWTYCFAYRFVLVRFIREPELGSGADLDEVISRTFLQLRDHFEHVHEPALFTHWVSVVCRNAIRTYRRRRSPVAFTVGDLEVVEGAREEEPPPETYGADLDRALVRRVVEEAIAQMPVAIQPAATLRLLDGHSYEYIAAETGLAVPTVRTYVARALARLREDPALRLLAGAPAETGGDGAVKARRTRA